MKRIFKDWIVLGMVGILTVPFVICIIGINFVLLCIEYLKLMLKRI